jgi:hypothetical protein
MHHRLSSRVSLIVLAVLAAASTLALVGCGSGTDSSSSPSAAPSAAPTTVSAYSWSEAGAHMGETATFDGPVVATFYDKAVEGHPAFLNLGVDYPDPARLTVIVWEKDRAAFPQTPKAMYAGKTIRVTGTVIEYEKAPAIAASSPDAIEVLD